MNYTTITVFALAVLFLIAGIWYATQPEAPTETPKGKYEVAPIVPFDSIIIPDDLGDGKG